MSTYFESSAFVKTRGPVSRRRAESATARSGIASREMRVAVDEFCRVFAALRGLAALRAALEVLLGMWLWEGLYGCSFCAASLVERDLVQNRCGGGFLVSWGVDGATCRLKMQKKGFSFEQNITERI